MVEGQKEFYRQQLQKDNSKDFSEEFIRTTDLERKLIDEFKFEGIKLIFENQNSANYFLLGQFPEECPWSNLNSETIIGVIQRNFAPIEEKIPMLLEAMQARCKFIFTEKQGQTWKLHYFLDMTLYDNRNYFRIYTGALPNPAPNINENLRKYGWTIPQDLKKFYSIHDGFGEINNGYLLSSSEISVLAEIMNPICEKQNFELPKDYKFENLLEFFPDGAGNVQCFYRNNPNSAFTITVDWDHETWEISNESNFYDFIDERMSEIDEE